MRPAGYEYQSDFARKHFNAGKADGRAEGRAEGILGLLGARGLLISDEVRTRITSCADLDLLEIWIRRAVTAGSAEELFD